jgi:hypothetical protein
MIGRNGLDAIERRFPTIETARPKSIQRLARVDQATEVNKGPRVSVAPWYGEQRPPIPVCIDRHQPRGQRDYWALLDKVSKSANRGSPTH